MLSQEKQSIRYNPSTDSRQLVVSPEWSSIATKASPVWEESSSERILARHQIPTVKSLPLLHYQVRLFGPAFNFQELSPAVVKDIAPIMPLVFILP